MLLNLNLFTNDTVLNYSGKASLTVSTIVILLSSLE